MTVVGHPSGFIGEACNSPSQGCEFKCHNGYRNYLVKSFFKKMEVVSYLKIHLNNYFHGVGQGEQTFSVKGQMAVICYLWLSRPYDLNSIIVVQKEP